MPQPTRTSSHRPHEAATLAPPRSVRRARLLAGVWALVIAALLLVPLPPEQEDYLPHWLARLLGQGADALVHGGLFFGFAYLLLGALDSRRWRKTFAFALAVGYGALTEWLQPRISGRTSEWRDLVADAVGALAGVVAVWVVERVRRPALGSPPQGESS